MKFLFKYATMGRPEWFKKTLETYYSMLSGLHEYEFIISLNRDDESMNNVQMKKYLFKFKNLKKYYGDHDNKIAAMNANMSGRDFDILFAISDDMVPEVQGFDDVIAKDMLKFFPDIDGALHYHDGLYGKDKTITLSIMGKALYDHFGYIYHPDYKSFYCDNEFTDEVRRLDKCVYIPSTPVKHVYKCNGTDDVYAMNSIKGKPDKTTYENRKQLGFPKESVCSG
jgi:hypothetical protein